MVLGIVTAVVGFCMYSNVKLWASSLSPDAKLRAKARATAAAVHAAHLDIRRARLGKVPWAHEHSSSAHAAACTVRAPLGTAEAAAGRRRRPRMRRAPCSCRAGTRGRWWGPAASSASGIAAPACTRPPTPCWACSPAWPAPAAPARPRRPPCTAARYPWPPRCGWGCHGTPRRRLMPAQPAGRGPSCPHRQLAAAQPAGAPPAALLRPVWVTQGLRDPMVLPASAPPSPAPSLRGPAANLQGAVSPADKGLLARTSSADVVCLLPTLGVHSPDGPDTPPASQPVTPSLLRCSPS